MRHVLRFVLFITFEVGMFVTQEDVDLNLLDNSENISEASRPRQIILTDEGCYSFLTLCYVYNRGKLKTQVCAYHTNFKLIDFENLCMVYLQNCLYTAERDAKKQYVPDLFYYNKKQHNCEYYIERGATFEDAVRLYYFDGSNTTDIKQTSLYLQK